MKLNFCTLFNSAYLSRGWAMYQSLLQQCDDFHLYVFAFDELCYHFLKQQNAPHLTVVSLKEFENDALLAVKPTRSAAEYCWTCSASTIHYCFETFQLSNCTYIDADMLFYSDPRILVEEMGDHSVLITSHRYTSAYDQSLASGKYCVQFVCFKNDVRGRAVLHWWKDACIDWCYARVENGKFGDQKYLDEFAIRFEGVHELQHLGGGLAPWNIQQYQFKYTHNKLQGIEKLSQKKFDVVFYHFHGLKFFEPNIVSLTDAQYAINSSIQQLFYFPYIKHLNQAKRFINSVDTSFNPHGNSGLAPYSKLSLKTLLRFYKEGIQNSRRNILGFGLRKRIQHHYFFDNTAT